MATDLKTSPELTTSISCWIKLGVSAGLNAQEFGQWVDTTIEECAGLKSRDVSSSNSIADPKTASTIAVIGEDCHSSAIKVHNLVACLSEEECAQVADTVSTYLDRAFDELRKAFWTFGNQGLEKVKTKNGHGTISGCVLLEILYEVSRVYEIGKLAFQYFELAADANLVSGLVELLDVQPYKQVLPATRGPEGVTCGICKQSAELLFSCRNEQRKIEPKMCISNEKSFDDSLEEWDMVPRIGHISSGLDIEATDASEEKETESPAKSTTAVKGSGAASLSDFDDDDYAIVDLGAEESSFCMGSMPTLSKGAGLHFEQATSKVIKLLIANVDRLQRISAFFNDEELAENNVEKEAEFHTATLVLDGPRINPFTSLQRRKLPMPLSPGTLRAPFIIASDVGADDANGLKFRDSRYHES
ncbi:hypothetical protein IWX49DRAFT_589187 [Phyllosticta citricarpa]|uniref:Uncharacterized protein n=2 Tax=Phyllosticta TaxID=121621 RepID=A0ABR1M829_9PEZI